MDPLHWRKIEELFNVAVELPIAERHTFLTSECGADVGLRKEIDALLSECDSPAAFLSESNFALGAQVLSADSADSLAGKVFGNYTIIRPVARGGMGEVYLACDNQLGRKVALKLLPNLLAGDEERVRRFKHEARAASAISHAHIAHVYEVGEFENRVFIAMEFVDGVTLRQRISRGELQLGEAVNIAVQLARAISAAHAEGIIHRDIKPENVIVSAAGAIKVVDFGLAKLVEPRLGSQQLHETNFGTRQTQLINTEPGLLLGTATYMSPEQARGQEVDTRTDIWSLGVVLYEMLTGQTPFRGATNSDVIAEILKTEPPFPRDQTAAGSATRILMRALSKEPDDRYQTAFDLVQALEQFHAELKATDALALPLPLTREPDKDHRKTIEPGFSQAAQYNRQTAVTKASSQIVAPHRRRNPLFTRRNLLATASIVLVFLVASVILLRRKNLLTLANRPNPSASTARMRSDQFVIKNQLGIELIYIPPGEFVMGSENGDSDEKPVHPVSIAKGFFIGRYEVTQAQWQAVMQNNSSFFRGDELPVDEVSWNDAQEFIGKLNALKDGYAYRLPSEAEWEYACRAGTTTDYAGPIEAMAWYFDNANRGSHPIGLKEPNGFGLYDVHGNVWEWCEDWYHKTYEGAPPDGSAWITGGEQKVKMLRGGSWYDTAERLRSAHRGGNPPVLRGLNLGLRIVATPIS